MEGNNFGPSFKVVPVLRRNQLSINNAEEARPNFLRGIAAIRIQSGCGSKEEAGS